MTLKIKFWHFLTAILGHLTRLMKKSNAFLWSVQSYLQSEMFVSNSVDVMKNLLQFLYVQYLVLKTEKMLVLMPWDRPGLWKDNCSACQFLSTKKEYDYYQTQTVYELFYIVSCLINIIIKILSWAQMFPLLRKFLTKNLFKLFNTQHVQL